MSTDSVDGMPEHSNQCALFVCVRIQGASLVAEVDVECNVTLLFHEPNDHREHKLTHQVVDVPGPLNSISRLGDSLSLRWRLRGADWTAHTSAENEASTP